MSIYPIINSYFSHLPLHCNNLKQIKKKKSCKEELKWRSLHDFHTTRNLFVLLYPIPSHLPQIKQLKELFLRKRSMKLQAGICTSIPKTNENFLTPVSINSRCETKHSNLKMCTRKNTLKTLSMQMCFTYYLCVEKKGRSFFAGVKNENEDSLKLTLRGSSKMVLQRIRPEIRAADFTQHVGNM